MKYFLKIFLILFVVSAQSQVTFNTIPLDKQLVGRDVNTNLGTVIVDGEVDNTAVTYDTLVIELYRDNVLQNTFSQGLSYTANVATFSFNFTITAELTNYSISVYGENQGLRTLEKSVDEIVSGDVFIIQGQSNAEAEMYSGSASMNQNDFIRVYASGTSNESTLLSQDQWYVGEGDGPAETTPGNTGQWGLKLARTLIDSLNIPVAIFNGANPGRNIKTFVAPVDYQTSLTKNYGRLYYRLNRTGLKDFVRGVIWSQGESDGAAFSIAPTLTEYKNFFISIKDSWLIDYPNIEKIYIFQTKNGCFGPFRDIKEAQRQLAVENDNISIMSTAAAVHNSDNCHFVYADGYELFAERIFPLIYRDIYGFSTADDIDAPMIQNAKLFGDTTLIVETNATTLSIDSVAEDFLLENAGGATITNITTSSGNIVFTLSANPGLNATISYLAQAQDPGNFITNLEDIEILCFDKYPIQIGSPLLITQYYEGENSDQWIEIKNISPVPIAANDYHLALYEDANTSINIIDIQSPDQSIAIDAMNAGDVRIYKNTSAMLPLLGNLGSAGVNTAVCTFDGNDVILISKSDNTDCYEDRIDIIGVVSSSASPVTWGENISLIKGSSTNEEPSLVYDSSDYIELTLDEVNTAVNGTNIQLGTQNIGATTYDGVWTNGVADRTRHITIASNYNNAFEANNLIIDSGVTVDFNNGSSNSILIAGDLTVNGTFIIGDTESLLMTDPEASINGDIAKIENTAILNNFRDYTYWSSPVNTTIEAAFVNITPGVDPNRIFLWRTPSMGDTGNWEVASGTMLKGRGYLAEAPSTIVNGQQHEVTFTGIPNNGSVELQLGIDLTDVDGYGGYNIIGNPYPSAIDIDEFITKDIANVQGPTTDGTIWLWSHNTPVNTTTGEFEASDYVTYNLVGGVGNGLVDPYIGSGQGFLIRRISTTGDGTVTFDNTMRVKDKNDTQFFKSVDKADKNTVEKDRIWLKIESEGGKTNQTLIGFFDKATDDFDIGYDALKLDGSDLGLYTSIDDDFYAIQGFAPFDEFTSIPLGFYSYEDKSFKISIVNAEGVLKDKHVYLVDNELNISHDLKQNEYSFSVEELGNYNERFVLQFNEGVLGIGDFEVNDSFVVTNQQDAFHIKTNDNITQIKIYDMIGRLLIKSLPNASDFEVPTQGIKTGTILILNATNINGKEFSRKVIKY